MRLAKPSAKLEHFQHMRSSLQIWLISGNCWYDWLEVSYAEQYAYISTKPGGVWFNATLRRHNVGARVVAWNTFSHRASRKSIILRLDEDVKVMYMQFHVVRHFYDVFPI